MIRMLRITDVNINGSPRVSRSSQFLGALLMKAKFFCIRTFFSKNIILFISDKSDVVAYCTNAVRKDKGSVFCTTHMIMTGQREPKRKKLVQKVTIDKVKMEDDPDIWVDNSGDNSTWLNNVKTELIEQPVVCLENVNYEQNRINSVSVVHGYESPEGILFNFIFVM